MQVILVWEKRPRKAQEYQIISDMMCPWATACQVKPS